MKTGRMSPRKKKTTRSAAAEDLLKRLQGFQAAPVLFVGSGISLRYLGLPNWSGLLSELADKTAKPYADYYSRASGDLPAVASLMSEPLHDLLWSKGGAALRKAYEPHLTKSDSALKVYVSDRMKDAVKSIPTTGELADEIAFLRKVTADAVITTNYDLLLEDIFPDFQVFVGQDELVFSDIQGIGELYKIHGSIESPNSLVLNTKDYDRYNDRNAYLAAKLLTIFAEHPVLFLGYSLNDTNVQETITALAKCLTTENLPKLQDRLILVEYQASAAPSLTPAVISRDGYNIPVLRLVVADFLETFQVLGQLERKFPAGMLRRLKEHVYELVRDNDPKNRLGVIDIDDAKNIGDLDVVFGVGAIAALGEQGYVGLSRINLCHDLLHDDANYTPKKVVEQSLPALCSRAGFWPHLKYLKAAGFLDANGALIRESELDPKLVKRIKQGAKPYLPTDSQRKHAAAVAKAAGNFATLAKRPDVADVLTCIGALPADKVPAKALKAYLVKHQASQISGDTMTTAYAKAVCLYDRLLYGPTPAW